MSEGTHVLRHAITIYQTQVSLGSDLWVRLSQTDYKTPFADLTDVTLADDEDTNSIQTN